MTPSPHNNPVPGQDLVWQSRMWIVERIGWGAMLIVLICASVGLFGHGPLSTAVVKQTSLRAEYERFARYRAPMNLRLFLAPTVQKQGLLTVWLSNEYLRHVEVVGTQPAATRTDLSSDGLRFIFSAEKETSISTISFQLRPDRVGAIVGSLAIDDEPAITFAHFIYP
jgi:hypothetical protein